MNTGIFGFSSKNCPCYKCDNREVGCHSSCEKYLKFRDDLDKYNEHCKSIKESLEFDGRFSY